MSSDSSKVILIGYGNPGRLDDGLGPALIARIEKSPLKGLALDADYQLNVENAMDISRYDIVIFADASLEGEKPFYFNEIEPSPPMSFSSHSISPESVLYMARTAFNAKTKGYVLGIRGYEFDGFGEKLSEGAEKNLDKAFNFIVSMIRTEWLNKPV